ncbi:MAG: hypothetical protein ACOYOF_11735 [Verrucomicrobiaceae bacterium]
MELVENRLAVVLNQDADQARKFAERANERLGRLKSRYAGVPAAKSKAELNKQQAGMVEARRVELEEMMVGELEHRMSGMHGRYAWAGNQAARASAGGCLAALGHAPEADLPQLAHESGALSN